jgi:hypothetical protein
MPESPRRFVISCGVMAVAAAVILPARAADAVTPPVFWVSGTGNSAHANVSCPTARYSTVQSAVTAAETYESSHPGVVPSVEVCPGTYSEQVTIRKSLALSRAPVPASQGAVTIQLPAAVGSDQSKGLSSTNCQAKDAANGIAVPQSVVEICAAGTGGTNTTGVKVAVSDLTVEGNWPHSVCYDSLYGILVGGGASLTLTGSTVEKAGAYPLNGCQGGVGIQVGRNVIGQIGHVNLSRDTIETYQKNGVTADGPGSTAAISHAVVIGAGATDVTAQNGIQLSRGAAGQVTDSSVSGNNYTGANNASSAGILVFGGCGSPLVQNAHIVRNRLTGNDVGVYLSDGDPTCTKSPSTHTSNMACFNVIENSHGYPGGHPSANANRTGWSVSPAVGFQAGVSDLGNRDEICENAISGAGYAPLGATHSLPHPPAPAFVRPVDIVTGPAIQPETFGNSFDGRPYHPA